jgi:endogenous inhibitor of DNA gyrase (YacG/DUF329 family)
MSDTPTPGAAPRCPICGKPADAKHRPFCSKRCALIDLGRWLNADYRVPTNEAPTDAPPDEEA